MEEAALREVIEQNILERIAESGNVEGLRGMTEKVRKVRQDFSGASWKGNSAVTSSLLFYAIETES